MRKLIASLLTVFLLTTLAIPCLAASVQRSKQKTSLDGVPVSCDVYNIDGSNYYKLRDVASLLNGTPSQFSVEWDASSSTISVHTSKPYDPVGGELEIGEDKSATAKPSSQTIVINGDTVSDLSVYNIGGNNYFKLRDLGKWLFFTVDYNRVADMVVIYSDDIFGCYDGC